MTVKIDNDRIWISNLPYAEELRHYFNISTYDGISYEAYKARIIQMLAEHLAALNKRGTGTHPLAAITGNEIIFQAFRFYEYDLNECIAKIREHAEFNQWKRSGDRMPAKSELRLVISNSGLRMKLEELHLDELIIKRRNNKLTIEADLPQSIQHVIVGHQLRDIVSHPMLDPIDIEITGVEDGCLMINDRQVSALPGEMPYPEYEQAVRQLAAWEKTWASGGELPIWE